MTVLTQTHTIKTKGRGLVEITDLAKDILSESKLQDGVLNIFCQHTSCSLVIMENVDPSARADLEYFFNKLVPENDPGFQHTVEGSDDMPSHIKMALTRTTEAIPFASGKLLLGTWQGLFLWEHRASPHSRRLVFSVLGEA